MTWLRQVDLTDARPDDNGAQSALGDTIVGGIERTVGQHITFKQASRFHLIEKQCELGRPHEAVYILDDEDLRLSRPDNTDVFTPQLVARIIDVLGTEIGEALTRWPSDNEINFGDVRFTQIGNVTTKSVIITKVGRIRRSRMRIELHRQHRLKASFHEALGHAAATSEQVDHRCHSITVL